MTAKSASAATAVLGCAGYLFYAFDISSGNGSLVITGLVILLLMTILVSGGIRKSNTANKYIVSITLTGLLALIITAFVVTGFPTEPFTVALESTSATSVLYGAALMFFAYTGYGRIATLGEEVYEPRTTISKAIILAMVIIVALYL